ncbi:MAG: PilZ domain-containing protein [Erythrobacter sp.]|uniref:PilZ domain-containing protein n=1 Tax=Erythrobacter sp. TaxID=1042 RepID=UPI003C76D423
MNAQADFRAAPRRPLNLMVKSRLNTRVVFAHVIDISETGCKVRAGAGFAEVGDRVTMKIGEIYAPLGKVVWVERHQAGISFEGEMHPAVLDHLCSVHGT